MYNVLFVLVFAVSVTILVGSLKEEATQTELCEAEGGVLIYTRPNHTCFTKDSVINLED